MPSHLQVFNGARGLAICGIFRYPFPFGVEFNINDNTCLYCLDGLKVFNG